MKMLSIFVMQILFLTRKFEFPTAGVAVVLSSKVPNGIIPQVGRSKYHIVGSARVTQQSFTEILLEKIAGKFLLNSPKV